MTTRFGWARRRAVLPATCVIAVLAFVAGCADSSSGGSGNESDEIVIGTTLPLTSPIGTQAQFALNGYKMAIDEINDAGGIDGRQVRLVSKDDKYDPALSKQLTRDEIAEGGLTAVLGSYGTTVSLTQSAEADAAGVPGVYPFAASPEFVDRKLEHVFGTYPLSTDAERSFDDFLLSEVKPAKVAILYFDTAFGISGAESSRDYLEKNGVEVPVFEKFAPDASDFTQLMTQVRSAGVDVVKMIAQTNAYPGYVAALNQVDPGVKAAYMETQIPFDPSVQKLVGADGDLMLGSAYWYPGAAPEFEAAYKAKYDTPVDAQGVFSYSAAKVLLDAIDRANSLDADDITAALRETSLDTPMGTVEFDDRQTYTTDFKIGQVSGDHVELVWPSDVATAPWQPRA